ncbi:MAG: hypothetical protein PWP65_792 [Clostridia bacterium]|nr:hypothetical protein [Clostridia bacterium]
MVKETFPGIFYALLLQDFPESLVETMAVFSILNLRLRDKKVLFIALLQTLTNLVRLLPIAFGMHTVILSLSLAIYTRLITKAQLSKIFLAILITFVIIGVVELIYSEPLLKVTGLKYETVFADPVLRAAFALPYEIVLLVVALSKNYYNQRKGLIC